MAAAALSLPFSRMASNQGSIAIKEHQRSKRRPSSNASSSSPPSFSTLTAGNRSAPTTITTRVQVGGVAPQTTLTVGAGRPLDPALVAASVSPASLSKSLPTFDDDDDDAAVVSTMKEKKVGWLKTIIPDKLVHYDPSKDPRLHSL